MTESRPISEEIIQVLHLHAQRTWHDEAYIVANRAALLALKSRIEVALQQEQACGAFVPADGEEFHLHVLLDDANWQSESWQRRALPYTDEAASASSANRCFPEGNVLCGTCAEKADETEE